MNNQEPEQRWAQTEDERCTSRAAQAGNLRCERWKLHPNQHEYRVREDYTFGWGQTREDALEASLTELRELTERAMAELRWMVNPQQGVLHTAADVTTILDDYEAWERRQA